MTVENLMTRLATLITVTDDGPPDIYGNATSQESETAVRCELQQMRRDESGDPESWQVGAWRLLLPAGTSVAGVDRIVVDSVEYEFDGPPWQVRKPRTGKTSHIEATVRSVA